MGAYLDWKQIVLHVIAAAFVGLLLARWLFERKR
jgi:hypothetical protein